MIIELEICDKTVEAFRRIFKSKEEVDYREIKLVVNELKISRRDLALVRLWLGVKSLERPDYSRHWLLRYGSEGRRKLYGMEQQNQ